MSEKVAQAADAISIKRLVAADLEAVVALDRELSGGSRRGFFQKRWQATERNPQAFIAYGAFRDDVLQGFALGHVLHGEFGGTDPVAVLDALGVASDEQAQGLGHRLIEHVVETVRELGGRELRTQMAWDQSGLATFFASCGFALTPRLVLERSTSSVTF